MARRIIICDQRNKLVATLEAILRHWGYRVLSVGSAAQVLELLEEIEPELLFLNGGQVQADARLGTHLEKARSPDSRMPVVLLDDPLEPSGTYPGLDHLHVPFDIFELFGLVQKHLEKVPRRNLRMDISLPGLIICNKTNQLIEVLSLSSHGLFVKSGLKTRVGEEVTIVLPLIGLKREIEVLCRVLYVIQPSHENNYLHGFGVEFSEPSERTLEIIRQYLEKRLLSEIGNHSAGKNGVEIDQLQTHSLPQQNR